MGSVVRVVRKTGLLWHLCVGDVFTMWDHEGTDMTCMVGGPEVDGQIPVWVDVDGEWRITEQDKHEHVIHEDWT